ncbi:hypothetical protein C5F50_06875 [Nitrosopumilus ureiphilus]|uniref:Uncharacterized protein n=1 Tax=Nitrosopumilus ureiphilus TaxID=1470067 RepID=A0A7D5M855_9ARCH|nr:hypothetical protein C5F50_06875 [Nitrosopumilus ureiphilus]
MNSLRDTNFIKSQNNEEKTTLFVSRNQPINSNDDIILSKSIFYACNRCDGALIPISICIFCKRPSLRSCTNCDMTIDTRYHESCKILISFGNTISKKKYRGIKRMKKQIIGVQH